MRGLNTDFTDHGSVICVCLCQNLCYLCLFMYSIKNLLNLNYWFSEPQPLNSLSLWLLLGFFCAMAAAAVVLYVTAQKKKDDKPLVRGLNKLSSLLAWMGLLGLVMVFFRYESAFFLSRRFWLGTWFVGLVVWLVFVVRYFKITMPKARANRQEQERLKRYLP